MLLRDEFNHHKTALQSFRKDLIEAQKQHQDAYRWYAKDADQFRRDCDDLLRDMPGLEAQIYVHIIGVPKALKTSYVLDLYKSKKLAEILDVKDAANSEHTACPCLITLVDGPTTLEKYGFEIGDTHEPISVAEFHQLYQVPENRVVTGGYLLRVSLSKADAAADAPNFPVIEYPGIEDSEEAEIQQKDLHDVFQADMMRAMTRYPGIVVACFETNVRLPNGHPLIEYKNFLAQYNQHVRPPLILSLNGVKAVAGFCGNTNVLNDINQYKAFKLFDLKIQLINPNPHDIDRYHLSKNDFPVPGSHVFDWISQLSDYTDIDHVKTEIEKDGGVSFSRTMLAKMTQQVEIRDIVDRIYLTPWLTKAQQAVATGKKLIQELRSFDLKSQLRQIVRDQVAANGYQTIDELYAAKKRDRPPFNNNMEYRDKVKSFWVDLVSTYFQQFSTNAKAQPGQPTSPKGCREVAAKVIDDLLAKINGGNTQWHFLFANEPDAPDLIMLNLLRFHLSALIMRGDTNFSDC